MSDNFETLHDLKLFIQHKLDDDGCVYHGGSILGDAMEAVLYITKHGNKYKIVITAEQQSDDK